VFFLKAFHSPPSCTAYWLVWLPSLCPCNRNFWSKLR
jgi:hypothetical protein